MNSLRDVPEHVLREITNFFEVGTFYVQPVSGGWGYRLAWLGSAHGGFREKPHTRNSIKSKSGARGGGTKINTKQHRGQKMLFPVCHGGVHIRTLTYYESILILVY